MATLSSIITPTNITTASNTQTLTNKTITGGIYNGTVGATTPSTGAFTTASSTLGANFATSSGSVGIGTASPNGTLQVSTGTNFTSILKVSDTSSEGTGFIVLGNGNSTDKAVGIWRADANSVSTGGLFLNIGGYGGIVFAASNALFGSQIERMRITSAGNVGIGTASPSAKLTVVSTTTPILSTFTSTLGGYDSYSTDDASGARFFSCFNSAGSVIGSISRVTTTNAVAFNTTSDARLKENFRDFTDSGRLIDALKPRVFDWKDSDNNGKDVIGFIAQEEHAADPVFSHIGAITVGDDDPTIITKQWQRSDAALIPILVAELQSLRKRLAALESK